MFKIRKNTKRKGFSLVELVVVIIIIAILAVAVFAGGSAAIKKSQVSRTTSDLHNFSIAIESAMNETPAVANIKRAAASGDVAKSDFTKIIDAVTKNLPADYALHDATDISATDKNLKVDAVGESWFVMESDKLDAWDNPYYVIFDFGERHLKGQSDFYITVVSAGANAQTYVGRAIEQDDIFLLVQYSDGDVSAVTYKVEDSNLKVTKVTTGTPDTCETVKFDDAGKTVTGKGTAGTMLYAGGEDNTTYSGSALPVNF